MRVIFKGRGIKSMHPKQTSENRKTGMQYELFTKMANKKNPQFFQERHERRENLIMVNRAQLQACTWNRYNNSRRKESKEGYSKNYENIYTALFIK